MNNQKNTSDKLENLGPIYSGNRASYLQNDNESGEIDVSVVNWSNLYNVMYDRSFNEVTRYKMSMQKLYKN